MIHVSKTSHLNGHSPAVWQATTPTQPSLDALCDWLGEQRPEIDQVVHSYGGILLRGFDCLREVGDFQRVLDVVSPELLDYVGGSAPRRAVSGRIMTTTELPGHCSVPLHQEMAYTDNSPDRLAFFCVTPATSGGETTIGDMRHITARIDPDLIRRFEDHKGLQIRRNLPTAENAAHHPGVPRAWSVAFGTTERDEVDSIVVKSGWRNEWLPDGSMHLWQEVRPAMRTHPHTGESVWYNQLHRFTPIGLLKRAESDGDDEMVEKIRTAMSDAPYKLDHTFHGDGTPIADEDVTHVFDILTEEAKPVAWERGDFLLIDNILVSHGRRQFTGDRLILTALIRTAGVSA